MNRLTKHLKTSEATKAGFESDASTLRPWVANRVADIVIQSGVDEYINDIRQEPTFSGEELDQIFTSESRDNQVNKRMSLIMGNNDYIGKELFKYLGINYTDWLDVFHSPWAVSILWENEVIHTSFNTTGDKGIQSQVSLAYNANVLRSMSLEKARIADMFHTFKWNFEVSTTLMQAVIEIIGRSGSIQNPEYYRGLYSHETKSVWVSGSYVPHETVDAIMTWLSAYENHDIDTIAPIRHDKMESEKWRVDLLAGIFDELYARLLLHHVSEWDFHIKQIAEEVKAHAQKGELWKLC